MPILDTAAIAAVTKTQYTQRKVNNLVYQASIPFARMKKRTDFVGANKVVAFKYGSPQARGANFTSAIANMTATQYAKVTVTHVLDYAFGQVSGLAIAQADGQPGALLNVLKTEIDGAMYTAARNIAVALFRNGGGSRGRIASISTNTFTLTDPNDVVGFERGMVLNLSATDGTSGTKRSGTLTVNAVNRDTGVVTCSVNITTGIAAAAVNDFIFQNGDFEAVSTVLSGIPAWVPKTAPTGGENFFGLDRSVDPTRLAGLRYTANSGGPIEETLIKAAARLQREGAKPDTVYMNPADFANLVVALGSKANYDRSKSVKDADISFTGVNMLGPSGNMEIFPVAEVSTGDAWMLTADTWSFETAGGGPKILNEDDMKMRADATSDSYIFRIGYYGNVFCEAPGYNAYVQL